MEKGVAPSAPPRGSLEVATVLAAVADAGGIEVSGTCPTLVSVSSSLDGVMVGSSSFMRGVPMGVVSPSTLASLGIGGGSALAPFKSALV